jgi:hypothetical protein
MVLMVVGLALFGRCSNERKKGKDRSLRSLKWKKVQAKAEAALPFSFFPFPFSRVSRPQAATPISFAFANTSSMPPTM